MNVWKEFIPTFHHLTLKLEIVQSPTSEFWNLIEALTRAHYFTASIFSLKILVSELCNMKVGDMQTPLDEIGGV